tara:strand:- start:44 stop:391 length:348 start_codon:yes stop_codon:yes gene_type:complete
MEYEIKDGMVMIPEADFKTLTDVLEMKQDVAAFDHAILNADEFYPSELAKELLRGDRTPAHIFRRYRGFTQNDIAAKVGISQGMLSDIERGVKEGSLGTLMALAKALDVDLDELV